MATKPKGRPRSKGSALVDVERKFDDAIIPFILNNDRTTLVCTDLSTSSRRLFYCLYLVRQFHAFPINYSQLTTPNMKIVARHSKGPPGGNQRSMAAS